ncbi:MAG: hypothetical protein Q8M15_16195 [Bacteroidota bacterium]|nr:hypothetical protein [Bacteroidota bacterium]
MNKQEIEELLTVSEPNCISVIVPTHRFSEGKSEDSLVLNKAIERVKNLMNHKQKPQNLLVSKLDELHKQIDFSHTKDGLGIYISPAVSRIVHFPFPVKEKINIGHHFDSRELLYYKNISDYFVLSVSKKSIRLYSGKGDELKEIVNDDFPRLYHETYEYAPPSIASSNSFSNKSYEKDKSVIQETRLKAFQRSADRLLGKYLDTQIPIILSGGSKEVADYKKITKFQHFIIGSILGNYEYNKNEVADAAWDFMQEFTKRKRAILLSDFRELVGQKRVARGIKETMNAAKEGKGSMLLVEKDLEYKKPLLKKSVTEHVPDSDPVEKIIKTVVEKKGKVTFMDKGTLEDFGGIALILRYSDALS